MKVIGSSAVPARIRNVPRGRGFFSILVVAALAVTGLTAAAGAGAAGAAVSGGGAIAAPGPPGVEGTISQNNLRTGWDPSEPALTPAAVAGGSFGRVFSTAVSGQVYGQPLVIGNTLIVATETDRMYGLNASTGATLWKTRLGTPYTITTCPDLVPHIGVTGTPVYDPSTGTVYAMGLIHETRWNWHLFGLNVTTGRIVFKRRIAGHPTNDRHLTFRALPEDQRPGLLLLNGWVYAAFASHCDHNSYTGYVAGVKPATGKTTLWADENGVSDEKGGIWQSGAGIMSDGSGRIFVTSGNGISPPYGPGRRPPGQLAESVIRLQPQSNGSLRPRDFFSPANAPSLDAADVDFGGGGPTGLPFGTTNYPDLLAQAGKDGRIFVLNRDNLGGRRRGRHGNGAALAEARYAPQFGHPAFFADTNPLTSANASHSHDYMLYVGKNDFMREFKFRVSRGKPAFTDVANSTFTLGYASGAPAITSNGTGPSTGLVWEVHSAGPTGAHAYLGAWDLLPHRRSGGGVKLAEIWSAPIGTSSEFTNVATANGMVYVGTRNRHVLGFGFTTGAALLRSATAQFPDTPLGSASTRNVSVTATRTVTATGASVGSANTPVPFTLGQVTETVPGGKPVSVKFPVTLRTGDSLHASVSFAPSTVGGATGVVSFGTGARVPVPVSVPLIGEGTSTGLYATSPSLSFVLVENDGMLITNVPVGITKPLVTSIVNGGTKPVRVTSITKPSGPYTVSGLPKIGTVIRPGEALPVQITYVPTQAVTSSASLTITASAGTSATVALTGTGLQPVTKFTASPGTVNFGSVPVGHTATVMVHVTNAGNQPSLIGKTALPGGPFGTPLTATNGLPVNGGYKLVLPVSFHPTKKGAFSGTYKLSWTDLFGHHELNVPITGTGARKPHRAAEHHHRELERHAGGPGDRAS
jgi:hypothetical protein